MQYFEEGEGPPVLLLHGWGGRARRQWHKTVSGLRTSYRFYGLSLRGHGQSEEVPDPDYGWSELAGDCDALRRLVKVDRWVVAGYSFGAIVALEYASMYPEHVRAVCAVSPLMIPKSLALLMHFGRQPIASLLRLARALPPAVSSPMIHNIAKTRLRTLFHTVEMMRGWKPRSIHVPESVPTVIILGEEDRVSHGERVIAVASKPQVRMLENTGHFLLWRQRERFVREFRDVLQTYST